MPNNTTHLALTVGVAQSCGAEGRHLAHYRTVRRSGGDITRRTSYHRPGHQAVHRLMSLLRIEVNRKLHTQNDGQI